MRTQRARLSQGSEVIETTSGAVEYGRVGEGLPVLISHGGAGGYDQAIPGARLMRLPDGGHLRLGHIEEIREEISDFLRRAFATPA